MDGNAGEVGQEAAGVHARLPPLFGNAVAGQQVCTRYV